MTNPFAQISSIILSDELLDIAFRRGSKAAGKISKRTPRSVRFMRKENARMKEASSYICSRLLKIVKGFPSIDRIHPFFFELSSTLVDLQELKNHLAAIQGSVELIQQLSFKSLSELRGVRDDPLKLRKIRQRSFGRISSVVRRARNHLEFLENARKKFRTMPSINPHHSTIVVAGSPNTGKSTLVKIISTANPEIAYYPFTTRALILGHILIDDQPSVKVQIVDTPGLLDRPISERNEIEKQAIAAIRFLASVIVFMIDVSETNGYTLADQTHLYKEIQHTLPQIPYLLTFNKIDLASPAQLEAARTQFAKQQYFEIIALKKIGTDVIQKKALELIKINDARRSSNLDGMVE